MKNSFKILVTVLLFVNLISFAQGCSDAGFCSLTSHDNSEKTTKNSIEAGFVFAAAEKDVTVFSQYITYSREFNSKFSMSFKATSSVSNGSFGTRGNFGDAFITGNYKLKSKVEDKKWSIISGIKIPFTSANNKINEFPIPLVYQSSLGTFDLILGTNYNFKKWDFNAAVQIPVININKNSFVKEFSGTNLFETTNLFERKSDGLLRATYSHKTKNGKFVFKPNILFLYHFGEDTYQDTFGNRQSINGSSGITINGNLIANYKLNSNSSLETSLATPFVVREERPDGLTRKFTAGLSYKYNF